MLAESRMMIPDCRKRLEASLADLKATLVCYSLLSELKAACNFIKCTLFNIFSCFRKSLRSQISKILK